MKAKCYVKVLFFLLQFTGLVFLSAYGQSGKDGARIVSTVGVIYNRYDVMSASASAGATTITVSNIANLSSAAIAGAANNPYTTAALAFGDLIMIIKVQGATINTTNTSLYGAVSAYNNAGQYELQLVKGVTGNVITLCSPLASTFNVGAPQRVEVVRIPRLSALTINATFSLTGSAWTGGFTGGMPMGLDMPVFTTLPSGGAVGNYKSFRAMRGAARRAMSLGRGR